MGKFYGEIGYVITIETSPGIWEPTISTKNYYGDVIRNTRRLQTSGSVNDDINVSNIISILADPFAYENFHAIRYVVYMGTKWKVTDVDVQYPRLNLTLGGVYNG
ncbi:MAG: hypothetical protein K9L62_02205 [Vallitaleaceae bacterium]|nr:hypothetical protein [Vallitaleaceae bacterium]